MACCANCFALLFALIILVELIAGLVATSSAAFFNDKIYHVGYLRQFGTTLIFLADVAFASGLLYYSGKETFSIMRQTMNKEVTLNWVSGMCTVVTIVIFGLVIFSTPLGKPAIDVIYDAFVVYIVAIIFLAKVTISYMIYVRFGFGQWNSPSNTQRSLNNAYQNAIVTATKRDPERSLEQSISQIVDNHENTPAAQRGYTLYTVGSETPYEVRM